MKNLILPLLAAAALLVSCDSTSHFSFEEIEFDYPSSWTIKNQDTDDDTMAIMLEKPGDAIGYLFIEVFRENSAISDDEDPDVVGSYLAHVAHNIAEIFIPDENVTLTDELEDEDDIYYDTDNKPYEAIDFFEGTYYDSPYYGVVRSMIIDRYRITAYAQAGSEKELDQYIDKVYTTVHFKE